MARLSLSLLGPLHATLDGRPVGGFGYNKVRALLAYLAVEAGRAHAREALVGLLWPDQTDQAARTNLRQALATLREALGDAAASPPFLLTTRETVQFNPDSDFELDVRTFEAGLAACRSHPHRGPDRCRPCAARMQESVERYRGDFLSQFSVPDSVAFEEWIVLKRERLRQAVLEMLSCLAAYHERRGEYELAQRYVRRQVEFDPWREEAHRQLMRLLFRIGRRSEAIAQYETCRKVLAEALGVPPARETAELYNRIREGLELPAGGETETHRRLPAPPTALVGRERELNTLSELLSNPDCRLVTIAGPGGIGKTRLALEIARAEYPAFTHGAAFINLAPLNDPGGIAPAILSELGVPPQGRHDPEQLLIGYLQDKELLLVLDNFEHLLAGAGPVTAILQRAPGVTLLVTSRERLALQAEWLVELGGLDCPDAEGGRGLEGFSAARLFVQRARQAHSRFTLDDESERAVARICRQVEGMPLAIELAAASVRHRTCVELAAELEAGLSDLTAARDVPERHQSMRAAFEQSWRLLPDEERRVFMQLAVFRGGFDEQAALQVANASRPILAALRDKSLLGGEPGGRHEMHELVRQYAEEKLLDAPEVEEVRTRHMACFTELAEAAETELLGGEQQHWLDRIEAEHHNLSAALAWADERDQADSMARLAGSLIRYFTVRGHLDQGRRWLEAALARKDGLPAGLRAKTLRAAGFLAISQMEYLPAREWVEEALAIYRALGDTRGVTDALNEMGNLAFIQERYDEAGPYYEETLGLCRDLNDRYGIAIELSNLGVVALHLGDYPRARTLLEQSLSLSRALGHKHNDIIVLCNLGLLSMLEGRDLPAREWFKESLALASELGDKQNIAACLEGLAALAGRRSQPARAARLYGAAETLRTRIGTPLLVPDREHYQQMTAYARAQLDEAAFRAAWTEGEALTLEQAIAEGLTEEGPS